MSSPSTFELKVYGLNACHALWTHRAEDIIRVYVTPERMREVGPLLKWCAARRKAYHVLSYEELATVAHSVHHEGMVLLARMPLPTTDDGLLHDLARSKDQAQALLYFDGVENPHNIGAICRVAAHFGTPWIVGADEHLPRLTSAAVRIAEGGTEHVRLATLKEPRSTLARLRAELGFELIATSSHGTASIHDQPLPRRALIIMGGEVGGASPERLSDASRIVKIPGTGAVESLNVAVAAGLILGEHWRLHAAGARGSRP